MTVIAAVLTKAGGAIVAADSLVAKGSGETFPAPKLRRVPRLGIAAAAGDDEAAHLFLDWMASGGDLKLRPRMRREWTWEGMLVTRTKILDYGCSSAPFPDEVKRPFHAIGVGADAALAVLAYQAKHFLPLDPRSAIEAVCDIHHDCGGPVDFLTLRPPR